jgi:hypothetical protein
LQTETAGLDGLVEVYAVEVFKALGDAEGEGFGLGEDGGIEVLSFIERFELCLFPSRLIQH